MQLDASSKIMFRIIKNISKKILTSNRRISAVVKVKYLSIISVLAVIVFLFTAAPAQAHPYMYFGGENTIEYWSSLEQLAGEFDNILDDMLIGIIGCARWSTDCQGANSAYYRSVPGQDGPYWDGSDGRGDHGTTNTGSGSAWDYASKGAGFKFIDSRCLAMLDAILNPNVHTNLPPATVNAIRAAFAANIQRAYNTEITIYGIRASASYLICTIDQTMNLPTNSSQSINVCGITSLDFDVPSWYKPDSVTGKGDPLVESADPRLDDALINLTAAYMTLGGQKMVDYWYAFYGKIIHIIITDLLDDIIADMIGKASNDEKVINALLEAGPENWNLTPDPELYAPDPDALNSKAVCNPWGTTINIDFTFPVSFKEIKPTIDVRIRMSDVNVCNTIRIFADTNLVPSQYTTMTTYLGMQSNQGNLNGDSRNNYTTYSDVFVNTQTQNPSVAKWLLREDIFPDPIPGMELQPIGRTDSPLTYGTDSWTMSVAIDLGDGTIWTPNNLPPTAPRFSYQWLWGNSAADVNTPVSGGTARTLNINPVNWLGSRFFRCLITDPWGKASIYSNVAEVKTKAPDIVVTQQPTVSPTPPIPGMTPFSITCNATQTGGTLSYQWQIDRTFSGSNWENVSDGDSNNVYNVASATGNDEGAYRCVITSVTFGNSVNTSMVGVQVNIPKPVITLQPVGANIDIGANYTFTCDATIDPTGPLTFQWEKDRVAIGSPIPGPGPVSLPIVNATPDDTGFYRCKVTSGTYSTHIYSAEVYLRVGAPSGAVFYVDKMAPRPTEDGLTWETAFDTIQEGIDAASAAGGGEVWVAGGPNGGGYVYNEDRPFPWGDLPVAGSLILEDNVALYGGFEGYHGKQEVTRAQRGVRRAVTIIDGSVSRGGAPAYHVVVIGKESSPTVGVRIDGFDIRGGRALGIAGDYHTWRGAAIYNYQSQPIIENCTFYDNIAVVSGGAIANETVGTAYANAQIVNCVFYQNHADRRYDTDSNPMRGGGAIFNDVADPTIVFCTFVANTINATPVDGSDLNLYGTVSGAIFNYNTTAVMTINSCIFWDNAPGVVETMCAADNPSCAPPNVLFTDLSQMIDPLFIGTPPEFKLADTSPCKNAADPALVSPNYDLQGVPRPQLGASDRGAYEMVDLAAYNIVCKNIEVSLDETGTVSFPASSLYNSAGSTVPGALWKLTVDGQRTVNLNCSAYPTKVLTLTATDMAGNQDTCEATVTLKDEIAPTAACKDITVSLNASGQYTLTAAEVDNGSTDNCSTVSLSIPATTYTCANIGVNVVQLTVTDGAGNTDTCLANVTVQDTTPPTVVTKNITVDLDSTGHATITPAQIENGSTDNCGVDTATFALDRTEFTCADRLVPQTVNLTVDDVNGNSASAPAQVTVRDVTPPVISVRGASEITLVTGVDCYVEEGASWTDVCDGTGEAVIGGDSVPSNCPLLPTDVGTYVVTYNYTDLGGNAAEQRTRTVRIISNQLPVITLLGDNPMTLACGTTYVEPGYVATDPEDGDLTDEVVVNSSELVTDPVSGYIVPGTYHIGYSVTDHDLSNPMSTTATRTLEVVDMDYPTVTLTGAEQLPWQLGKPFVDPGYSAEDPCWGDVTILTEVAGVVDVDTPGVYVLTYTPKDYSGLYGESVQREVYVGDFLQIVAHPQNADAYIDSNTFELSVTFTGGIFIPGYDTYTWLRGSEVVESGTVETGANTLELTVDPTAITPGTYMYHAEIKDLEGVHASNQARVRIGNHITLGDPIPNAEVVPGDKFSMTVQATGGVGSLHYQWQKSDGSKGWANVSNGANISGATTNTLAFNPFTAEDVGTYRCEITDDYTDMAYSNEVVLTKGSGIPVAGTIGITMLTALSALAGVFTLRRRQR